MNRVVRCAWVLLLLASVGSSTQQPVNNATASGESDAAKTLGHASLTPSATESRFITASTALPKTSTCISRTVNYITHTLPQQCLRTDRTSHNGTQTSSVLSSEHATPRSGSQLPLESTHVLESTVQTSRPDSGEATGTKEPGASAAHSTTNSVVPTASESAAVVVREPEVESDPLLDDANFLSFEEWKKQNLARTGQSPDNVGQERPPSGERHRPGINNALDTLGEESEIDLDFSGFGGGAPKPSRSDSSATSEPAASGQSTTPAYKLRSKDAGRTCKERTNYASFDCSANILKSNPECKSASSVLVENKDSYMLNTCTANNKFFIVELCNDIHIDTIVLANYEFFSSIFRHFRMSVSDRYPVKMDKWKELGTFEARNTREVQAFLVEDPQIWARYLRIEFLTHYGSEYYCPVSLLRVHGKTMMQEFRQEEELARGELPDEEPVLETETNAEAAAQEPLTATVESGHPTVQAMQSINVTLTESTGAEYNDTVATNAAETSDPTNQTVAVSEELRDPEFDLSTCAPSSQTSRGPNVSTLAASSISSDPTETPAKSSTSSSTSSLNQNVQISQVHSDTGRISSSSGGDSASTRLITQTHEKSSLSTTPVTALSTMNASASGGAEQSAASNLQPPSSSIASSASNSTRAAATPSPSPQASSQESFFKSIHKRLQQLESNSTLSLQYIEEQSRILRDAFNKVEKRQITATSVFLSHLNETVMTELHGFRQAYDQLWQSTVIELEGQREQYQREMLALSTRLTLVADELVWQKRMGIVQSTLLLLCLGMVLFARQGNSYLDMTLAQQLMSKSQAALRAGWDSEPNSPSPASRSPVSLFRRKIWRSSTEPVNGTLTDESESRPETREGGFEMEVQPPTPPDMMGDSESDESEFEDATGTQSGPATPNGTAAGLKRSPSMPFGGRPSSPLRYQ